VSSYGAQSASPFLDRIYQFAELIVGNPENKGLDLVIDVSPPNNRLFDPKLKLHEEAGFPKIKTCFTQYKAFLDSIDLYVDKLSNGQASWEGDLVHHPQTETSEFDSLVTIDGKVVKTGWAGFEAPVPSDPTKTFTLTSDQSKDYGAYIDWMGAFNVYITVRGQKTFSEFFLSLRPRTNAVVSTICLGLTRRVPVQAIRLCWPVASRPLSLRFHLPSPIRRWPIGTVSTLVANEALMATRRRSMTS